MNRRHFIGYSTVSLGLLPFISSCKLSQKMPILPQINDAYKFSEIRRGVGIFEGKGGTIGWSFSKDEVSIIDTQFPEQVTWLLSELDKYNHDGKIDLLINTHHHGDHTSGNIVLKERIIRHVAHENAIFNYKKVTSQQKTVEKALYPSISFTDQTTFKVGDEKLNLTYFGPAHTNGDIIVHYEKANVVHLGDLIFNRRFPYIDKSSGANIQSWITVLDSVLKAFDNETIFIFGHKGEGYQVTGSKEDIRAFQNYLEKLLAFGRTSITSGISLDTLKNTTKFISGAEEWKGDGIERSLDAVYQELNQ